ncbi:MAG: hypothetical protein R2764_10830 [Bacteroidales bacterium]
MNRNLLFVIVSMLIITATYAQQPENPGYESWENVGSATVEPLEWSSIKTADAFGTFAPQVCDRSSDAHTGSYSVKLFSANTFIGVIAPGTVTNGRLHAEFSGTGWSFTDPNDDRWNTPLTQKPDSIVIWAKHFPEGGDIAQVSAVIHTGTAISPDVNKTNYVAEAKILIPDAHANWTRFSAPFTYLNGNDPEYILIVVSTADENATLGTESYFDDIELIYNPVMLDLTVFMQGPYISGNAMSTNLNPDHLPLDQPYNTAPWNYNGTENVATMPADVVDWVLVEIRDAASANAATSGSSLGMQAAFLKNDGSVVGLDGTSRVAFDVSINENLFVVLHHRNHLDIMSAYPVTKVGAFHTYNFSDANDKIYGTIDGFAQIDADLWGMASGDGDANGIIEQDDKTNFWSILVGKTGYLSADYNLTGKPTILIK